MSGLNRGCILNLGCVVHGLLKKWHISGASGFHTHTWHRIFNKIMIKFDSSYTLSTKDVPKEMLYHNFVFLPPNSQGHYYIVEMRATL